MTTPLSRDTQAVLAAALGYNDERIAIAQAFRALAFLAPREPLTQDQLIRIAMEIDP